MVSILLLSAGGIARANNRTDGPPVLGPCGSHIQVNFKSLNGNWRVQAIHANELGDLVDINDHCSLVESTAPAMIQHR